MIGVFALVGIGLTLARAYDISLPGVDNWGQILTLSPTHPRQVILIGGHKDYDSGAVCLDSAGNVSLTEADINIEIAERTAHRLRRSDLDVMIFGEYESQLDGLSADLVLSLHSDSCIDASGYKAARHPNSPDAAVEDIFLDCLNQHYSRITNLDYHSGTVTHDMLQYHMFNKVVPETPAVILEMGFMGGDGLLLSQEPGLVATGISESVLCFLDNTSNLDTSNTKD